MPLPLITPKILASGTPVIAGWNLVELNDVRATAAKSGSSTNYFFDFTVITGPENRDDNKDKSATFMVSGAALEQGIEDACGGYFSLMSCLSGIPAAELVGQEVDEEALKGKRCWALIQKRTYEGKEQNDFRAFMPDGTVPF